MPNLLTPVARRVGRDPRVVRLADVIVPADRLLRRGSRGRVSIIRLVGLDEVVLHLTGRRSGEARDTQLLAARGEGGVRLIAGSNWGKPQLPAWVHNLRASGATIEATCGGRRGPATWRELSGPERDAAWERLVTVWPAFPAYAARAGRPVPVFAIEPATATADKLRRN